MSAEQAVALIQDNDTVIISSSGGGVNEPTKLLAALEQRFLSTGHPANLVACHPCGLGDGKGGGTDRFAHPGMVRRVIAGHWSWSQGICRMVLENQIEAYCLPQGVLSHLFRAIGGGQPGVLTHVGLGTFVDPRVEGGKCNAATKDDFVQLVNLNGREYLFYPAFPVHVALVRGTTADEHGNITMEHEGVTVEALAAAMAAHNSGGLVLAQVKRVAKAGTLDARQVKIPGIMVDAIVVDETQTMSAFTAHSPAYAHEIKAPTTAFETLPLDARKVIARRAALELEPQAVVNLGFGIADGVAAVAAEEKVFDRITLTIEQGAIGGVPAGGGDFGLATNAEAVMDATYQFDFYNGGGIDMTVLSFAQVDAQGNVNVSRFAGRLIGPGGFINVSQNAKKACFCGTFTAGGLAVNIGDGRIQIAQEGKFPKFVQGVEQITYSGEYARQRGQQVLYITERAVFELGKQGLKLVEIAPGVDVERDIIAHMGFRPLIEGQPKVMDARIFNPELMDLAKRFD